MVISLQPRERHTDTPVLLADISGSAGCDHVTSRGWSVDFENSVNIKDVRENKNNKNKRNDEVSTNIKSSDENNKTNFL